MSKGMSSLIVAVFLILIAVSLALSFYSWGFDVSRVFEKTTKDVTKTKVSEEKSNFFITVVSGREVGIKNSGGIPLNTSDFSIYLNDTLVETTASTSKLGPGNATTFNITDSVSPGNYSIKVSGPYGKYESTSDELTITTSTSTTTSTTTTIYTNWWNTNWNFCRNIDIQGPNSQLTDYPVYIHLGDTTNMDRDSIRFIDTSCNNGGSVLSHEIESFSSSGADSWVKIPSLPSGGRTISVYYNNSAAPNIESPSMVWSNNYKSVYHLEHTSGTAEDSLGNHDAGESVSPNSNLDESGVVSKGDYFDGSNDYLGNNPEWDVDGDHLFCVWIKFSSGHDGTILEDGGNWDGHGLGVTNLGNFRYAERHNTIHDFIDGPAARNDGQWHFVCGGSTGSGMKLYVDGILRRENNNGNGDAGGNDARIGSGNSANPVFDDSNSHYFEGSMDELRVSTIMRTPDWIDYTYGMIKNQGYYIDIGPEIGDY